jgi:ABC-type multidrug transport system fused ATPase/permease subunit
VVRAFGREDEEKTSFVRDSDRLLVTTMKGSFFQSANMAISGFLTGIAPLIVTLFGGWRVIHGDISVGTLVAIGMYLPSLYLPLQRFSELNVVFATSMASLDRIFEIMDSPPSIADMPGAVDFPRGECAGAVEFRNVSFHYVEERPVLAGFNIKIEPGERLALVGRSGSGKTTISNLIPRFWDVDGGSVTVDGIDVRHMKLKSLRRHIGMVLQDPVLFSGTIKENILYGKPEASEAEVKDAARLANALDFISALPEGFDTEVGERGVSLSGGQKQRLTIARAFLKDPRILILDEATSALDAESERLIQEALERLMRERTTIIIAHRLSTVARADRILVIEDGRIVESGTHEELTKSDGVYRRFMALQLRS